MVKFHIVISAERVAELRAPSGVKGGRGQSQGSGVSTSPLPSSLSDPTEMNPTSLAFLYLLSEQGLKAPVTCFSAAVLWPSVTSVRSCTHHAYVLLLSTLRSPSLSVFQHNLGCPPTSNFHFSRVPILTPTSPRQKVLLYNMLTHHICGARLQFTSLRMLFPFICFQCGADSPNSLPGFLTSVFIALTVSQTWAASCPLWVSYRSSGHPGSFG